MNKLSKISIRKPYLVLVGDEIDRGYAKTGCGIVDWCRDDVIGQLRFSADAVDLGVPDLDVEAAAGQGAGSRFEGTVRWSTLLTSRTSPSPTTHARRW